MGEGETSSPRCCAQQNFIRSGQVIAQQAPSSDQRADLRADIRQLHRRHLALTFRFSDAPIHAFDLIGEYDAGNRRRDGHLKRITLDLRGHETAEHQACLAVIGGRTQHDRGPMTCLLSTCLWSEV